MIKIVLFDLDGVVIHREKYFSERLADDYNIPLESIMTFFKNEYSLCATGKVDIKDILPDYFKKWGWNKSMDEFLEFWFSNERDVDQRIIVIIDELRTQNISCYLASDNEKYRTEYVWNDVKLKNHFDGIFSSAYIGFRKSKKEFFEYVLKKLHPTPPNEILYFDDDLENLEQARQVGIKSKLYKNFDQFKNDIKKVT